MFTADRKTNLYLYRELLLKLIDLYGEDQLLYFYLTSNDEILSVSLVPNPFYQNYHCGQIELHRLYIYTLIEEYPQIQLALLVIIGYRVMRCYSSEQLATKLCCTKEQYLELEFGHLNFENQFTFDNLAKVLNIPREYFVSESYFHPRKYLGERYGINS